MKTPVRIILSGVSLCFTVSCVMTKAQGDSISGKIDLLEDEIAKVQRVRHDLEVLLNGKVKDLFERMANFEGQLSALRQVVTDNDNQSNKIITELQSIRSDMEEWQNKQSSLPVKGEQLSVPNNAKEHFLLAKNVLEEGKLKDALFLFNEFVLVHNKEEENTIESYFNIGEIHIKLKNLSNSKTEKTKHLKHSVIAFQKVIDYKKNNNLREESLFKIGLCLKELGNNDGAKAALNELLSHYKKSPRVLEAKKILAQIKE